MVSTSAHILDAMQPEHDLDLAGRVLWAAREAAAKALQDTAIDLRLLDSVRRSAWHFAAKSSLSRTDILVIVARLARGGDRVIAVTAQAASDDRPAEADDAGAASVAALRRGYGNLASHGATLSADGPDGQPCVSQRSMVTFREASEPSGNMRHSHFVNQMGALRELAAKPVLDRCVDDFMSGHWGAVTNRTRLVVVDRVAAGETVEARVWCAGVSGPLRSTMDLGFSWRAIDEGGGSRPLARGSMSTTWVALIGHGEARVAANPAYLDEFAARIAPGHGRPHADLDPPDGSERGELVYQASRHPGATAAYCRTFGTTREHSNVVGNVYFAHYVSWQGEAVDAMLASLHPEYARTRSSELRVESVAMDHFREAMPYDLVEVHVQVERVWQRGLALHAEVYRRTGSDLVKLAAGQLEGIWYAADGQGVWKPAALPGGIVDALCGDRFPLVPQATEARR
jgi:enediyne biosynthesis thioesterase